MLKYFNERGQQLNVVPVGFHWDMNEKELKQTLVDADGQVQEELVKLAQEIQKIIRDNYKKSLEDGAEAYNKILTSAEKLLELERQLSSSNTPRKNSIPTTVHAYISTPTTSMFRTSASGNSPVNSTTMEDVCC